MPRTQSDTSATPYMRLLVLGGPKSGKSTTCVATSPGGVYVINSDDEHSLRPAKEMCDSKGLHSHFEWDLAASYNSDGRIFEEIDAAVRQAREGVKSGKYATIVWDTITYYALRIEEILAAQTDVKGVGPDGRRYWPIYEKKLRNVVDRLFALPAHVIVTAHYVDVKGALIDDQLEKSGDGIVPMLGGKARSTIPAMFQDVVFLDKSREGERYFLASSAGVWGPGCRNLPPGVTKAPADIAKLWEIMTTKKGTK